MSDNTKRPHTCILNVMLECYMVNDKGECSDKVINKETLENMGIKSAFLLGVSGMDLEECINNLKNKLNRWNDD